MIQSILAALAGGVAGVVNSVAGGGTFFTFPVLTGPLRLSAKAASATNTVGLFPGYVAAVTAARQDIRRLPRRLVWGYLGTGAVGGAIGAALLRTTPMDSFGKVVPGLMLLATVTLAAGPRVSAWANRHVKDEKGKEPRFSARAFPLLLLISGYCGYFGAGAGILLLAGLAVAGLTDVRQMNTLKILIQVTANASAVIVFLTGGIDWRAAAFMGIGAAIGGFAGMIASQRVPAAWIRAIILTAGSVLTAVYVWRTWM